MADKKKKQIGDMNLRELDKFLKRDDITESERERAMKRLDSISRSDETRPYYPPVEQQQGKPERRKEDYTKGRQYVAHGGMVHRGRTAGQSAEKTG